MVEHDNGTVRRVAWSETFPWLRIVRAFRLAIGVRVLVLGALGAVIVATGWCLLAAPICDFSTPSEATGWLQPYVACPWKAVTDRRCPNCRVPPLRPGAMGTPSLRPRRRPASTCTTCSVGVYRQGVAPHDAVGGPVRLLTKPAGGAHEQGLRQAEPPVPDPLRAVGCGGVGAVRGGHLPHGRRATGGRRAGRLGRRVAVRLAKVARLFRRPAAARRRRALDGDPHRWCVGGSCIGSRSCLGGILWPLVLLAGFVMALLLLGALFGWPLMWGAISAEGTDSFDALSRSYAYTFQRPLSYLFYAAVAAVIGWLGWLLVQHFAAAVIWLSYWAAGWGCGQDQLNALMHGSKNLSAVAGLASG